MVDCEINTLPLHTPKGRKGSPFFLRLTTLGKPGGVLGLPYFYLNSLLDVLWILGGVIPSTEYNKDIEYINNIKNNSICLITVNQGQESGMPFVGNTFLLLTHAAAMEGNTKRCVQEAFGMYATSIGSKKFRVYTSVGWSEWY